MINVVAQTARLLTLHQDVARPSDGRHCWLWRDHEILIGEDRRGRHKGHAGADILRPQKFTAAHLLEDRFGAVLARRALEIDLA